MSHDIVIVPSYDRPEYLWVCLEKLRQAHGIEKKEIWVCVDGHEGDPRWHSGSDMEITIASAQSWFPGLKCCIRGRHSYYGNSYNILEAFREAYDWRTDARYVYLVEDDVMVMPDFFQWHEAAQEQFKPFVSCAGRINRSLNFETNGREAINESCKDPLACVLSRRAYGSWASCFKRETLALFKSFKDYSVFKPGVEQDIMIQQILRGTDSYSVWPYIPRAYHMGMSSYHRNAGLKFNGTFQEKVEALRSTISDRQKIRSMALLQDDIDPYPTEPIPDWSGSLYLKSDYR